MRYLVEIESNIIEKPEMLGGKATAFIKLQKHGFLTPQSACLPITAYRDFVSTTHLDRFIDQELNRKDFAELRWEEIWDISLRIRNHFLNVEWPNSLKETLLKELHQTINEWNGVAVRSSAIGEDSGMTSFAGLHESRIMLNDTDEVIDAVRIVWASLWSDRALLYRKELKLDPGSSVMAVLIQEMHIGESSGVLFTESPNDSKVMMAESVWGLNQAMVDGTIEPSNCLINRVNGEIIEQYNSHQTKALLPANTGYELIPLNDHRRSCSPLEKSLCKELYDIGCRLEHLMQTPVDIEWTAKDREIQILQVRPITSTISNSDDDRAWYRNLHLSLNRLELLQNEIENNILPGMDADAKEMFSINLNGLNDYELMDEFERRLNILDFWLTTYKDKCIPMAHGVRLFGEYYNDQVKPDDPFEFMKLLHCSDLLAVQRNNHLLELATQLSEDKERFTLLKNGDYAAGGNIIESTLARLEQDFRELEWIMPTEKDLISWLIHLAEQHPQPTKRTNILDDHEKSFFNTIPPNKHDFAKRILTVARNSYRLRDNDNIYLGKIRSAVTSAEIAIKERGLSGKNMGVFPHAFKSDKNTLFSTQQNNIENTYGGPRYAIRQLVGQPAGPGVGSGLARVLKSRDEILSFNKGEILVCDAIEPNMTFLAPLAAAIIERRGGMLIHGAIIAREYGIPCVTGVPDATKHIRTGDKLFVDGFLGIVTID